MRINWELIIIYYVVAIVVVVILHLLAKKVRNNYLRLLMRSGVAATLLTPWLLVGEGVAIVPASIIMVLGGNHMGWEEFVWGATPVAILWSVTFAIGAIFILIS